MKKTILLLGICAATVLLLSLDRGINGDDRYGNSALATFKEQSNDFVQATLRLQAAVRQLRPHDTAAAAEARQALIACRSSYKSIETLMEYLFEFPVNLYNRAPVYEVEEPYMEYQWPVGLQVVEGLLMEDEPYDHYKELDDQNTLITETAKGIKATMFGQKLTNGQLLEAIRLELVRIETLGITGYDAPLLKTGIQESAAALQSVQAYLQPILAAWPGPETDSLARSLERCIEMLHGPTNFDHFDRLQFIIAGMNPLQQHLAAFIRQSGMMLQTRAALNYDARNLFDPDALRKDSFNQLGTQPAMAALGKELFFEKRLSGNNTRSCASCHQPNRHYADGLAKSTTIDGNGFVQRNAPTLLYVAYQYAFFHDGRAVSLEEQMKEVLQNPKEMNGNVQQVLAFLINDSHYRQQFSKTFSNREEQAITLEHLAQCLAAFEQTLSPFGSKFDRYMAGDTSALDLQQKKGFNLFMGKAQCGTCHFAPIFNGLLPPNYGRTELEVLGVPQNGNLHRPKADADSGRYHFFPIKFNNGAFKTATVRNAAVTAPYMHNGVFKDLKSVMNFYNKGGGNGIGMNNENQTLSDKPLHLSKKEINQLVAFLNALTDE
ncbi:MAG: cytochrome c peroxidase [Edaphocola sp.]